MDRYFVKGDCHGNFNWLEGFCKDYNTTKKDYLIILGDAGINFWLNEKDKLLKEYISSFPITLLLVYGNHEERPEKISGISEQFSKKWNSFYYIEKEYSNIIYLKNGMIWINDEPCLIIGGAYSVDKDYRILTGKPWFEDEQLNEAEKRSIIQLVRGIQKYKYIFTHTAPLNYEPIHLFLRGINQTTVDKNMEIFLQKIRDNIDKDYLDTWYCGHYHNDEWLGGRIHMLYNNIIELNF